ncbi:MAG: hypothetical protein KI790_06595 [Cyclobacteriaceae bacterium]|nr:hypothetical protein [Cyclobacteriaceae bacterium HetDA_MAG_MS6]
MSLFDFARLLYRNAKAIGLVAVTMAVATFIFTYNAPKEYAVSALIYTGIASGFNLESGSADKIDYHAVNNAFDNLISIIQSRETQQEVLLKLLSKHIYLETQDGHNHVPEAFIEKYQLLLGEPENYVRSTSDSTYLHLRALFDDGDEKVKSIIDSENGPYSVGSLQTLEVKRHKSSDMLILYYKSTSPKISKETLELVIEVFTNRFRGIKEAETGNVVGYFQRQLDTAKNALSQAEDKLTFFRSGKRVINYGEQTKAIAIKKQNALDEYSRRKMNLAATQVALKEIEERLAIRESLLTKNAELIDKRNRLAELTQQMAHLQHQPDTEVSLSVLKNKINSYKSDIQKDLELIFNYSNTKEGLPSKQLLNEWLENIISLNREKANIEYYKQRLQELDNLYDSFAPLGSTLARLEREIDVREREYLEILNGLNMSKLRQQNIQMSNQLEVVDWPQTPTKAIESRRLFLVMTSFLFGITLMTSIFVAIDLLDHSLRSPGRTESVTGLPVAGALPHFDSKTDKQYPDLQQKAINHIIDRIGIENRKQLILVISAFAGEGKSTLSRLLTDKLELLGLNPQYFPLAVNQPNQERSASHMISMNIESEIENGFEGYTILQLPALVGRIIPKNLIESADQILWLGRADRSWTLAQQRLKERIEAMASGKIHIVLNGIKIYRLEDLLGDINPYRNESLKWIRRVVRFEFGLSFF